MNLLEPEESLATVEGWNTATEELEPWGEVPTEVSSIRVEATDRGPVYSIEAADGNWIAEVQPWGGSEPSTTLPYRSRRFEYPLWRLSA